MVDGNGKIILGLMWRSVPTWVAPRCRMRAYRPLPSTASSATSRSPISSLTACLARTACCCGTSARSVVALLMLAPTGMAGRKVTVFRVIVGQVSNYDIKVSNFTSSFKNGLAFCGGFRVGRQISSPAHCGCGCQRCCTSSGQHSFRGRSWWKPTILTEPWKRRFQSPKSTSAWNVSWIPRTLQTLAGRTKKLCAVTYRSCSKRLGSWQSKTHL